ncbi:MAG: YncE family protein [Ottowia sp.]|uniref:YncE family protein n=1 Tax=Ottowia sp. TaxID=1898956 RepID=UPI0039E54BAC
MYPNLSSRQGALQGRLLRGVLAVSAALALAACASGPQSGGAPQFGAQDAAFKGRVSVTDTPVVLAGKPVTLAGRDFTPGQKVSLSYGGVALGETATVGADGTFRTRFTLPASAAVGRYQLVASAANPAASLLVPLKISPDVPLSGQDRFSAQFKPLVPGLYQVAYSARNDRAFVTSTLSRPPNPRSELVKVNPQTLEIEARVTPPQAPAAANAPANAPAAVFSVFGVGVDDANGTVWVTNTSQNTVAVYSQADLKLVKQFEPGLVKHGRDVVVDEKQGKAYASPFGEAYVAVFDTKTLAKTRNIPVATTRRGPDVKGFSPLGLFVDEASAQLFAVSMTTNEVAVIDTRTDTVKQVWPLEGVDRASAVAYDAQGDRILVASQGTDNLLIVDAKTGKTLHDVKTGAGALSVTFDPARRLAYVANRGAGTVTVVDANGRIVGNLGGGTFPNHVLADGKGGVLAVNKARGENDPEGDRIGRITAR